MECLNCGGDVVQSVGRRSRLYCNDRCKGLYWKFKKPRESKVKVLSIAAYDALVLLSRGGVVVEKKVVRVREVKEAVLERRPGEPYIEYSIRLAEFKDEQLKNCR